MSKEDCQCLAPGSLLECDGRNEWHQYPFGVHQCALTSPIAIIGTKLDINERSGDTEADAATLKVLMVSERAEKSLTQHLTR
ncbi:unnamed protein product [Choristocarpus tenellus]